MTEFKREPRYIVLKIKDLENYCNTEAMVALRRIGERVAEGRRDHGKPPFNVVVVEQDWPEFEPTWEAIEGRMTGKPIEPRYAIALRVKALEAQLATARHESVAALDLVSRIREALGDNGQRMQDELLEWCRDLRKRASLTPDFNEIFQQGKAHL